MSDRHEPYAELLSLAVHEFRTPASVVGGYLRLLQRDTDPGLTERHRKLIDEAERSCERLVDLIGELSEIQKLDAEQIALPRQNFDLFAMVQDVASHVHEAEDRNVILQVEGAAAGAWVSGDLTRLQRAFRAIFRAILREAPANSTVVAERRLDEAAGPSSAVVIVSDQATVQASYAAARGTFDEKRGGLGLALPIARRILERHGGGVWSPQGDGNRSAAIVTLPLAE
jgi:signal transduction histidine kinase